MSGYRVCDKCGANVETSDEIADEPRGIHASATVFLCCGCRRSGWAPKTARPTSTEESPAYRIAMRDAGREHLLP